jgi:hypothetical protein
MATVMPTATYPKTYRINGEDFTFADVTSDTSFQAGPRYFAAATVLTYPKVLILGNHQIKAKDANEESSARTKFGQA